MTRDPRGGPVPDTIGPPAARPLPRRWLLIPGFLGVLALVGPLVVWWWLRPAPLDPPLPSGFLDPEMREEMEEARQRVRAAPRSADAWGRLGMTFLANAYWAEAERCFAEATRLDPADGQWPYYRALSMLGEDPDRALTFLRQAVAGTLPEEARAAVRLHLAEVLLEHQERDEAERLFLEHWRSHPGDPRAGFGLGLLAVARGDGKAAQEYLTAARASPVVRKSATARQAALARDRGDLKTAAALENEVATLPDDLRAWPDPLVLRLDRFRVGAFREAQDTSQLESQQRYAEAAAVYLQKLARAPTAENHVGAGLNLVRSGNAARGLKHLETGIRLQPERCESHYGQALALFLLATEERQRSPQSSKANDLFLAAAGAARRATELKPDYAEAFLLWGGALMGRGDPAAAIEPFRKGVACRPELFNLQLSLGEALLEAGKPQEAEIHLQNALQLEPGNERALQVLERLRKKRP